MSREDYLNYKLKKLDHISDILSFDYDLSMDVLKRAEDRIAEMYEKYNNAYTNTEKEYIKEQIGLLTHNYNYLKNKFENDKDKQQSIEKQETEIDKDERKVGTYGRSYNSGRVGYTRKELVEIQKLIPDIHQ